MKWNFLRRLNLIEINRDKIKTQLLVLHHDADYSFAAILYCIEITTTLLNKKIAAQIATKNGEPPAQTNFKSSWKSWDQIYIL